jgi:histone H3/H4
MSRIKNVPRKSNAAVSRKVSPFPKIKTKQKSVTSFGIPHLKALKNHHARNIPHAPGVPHLKKSTVFRRGTVALLEVRAYQRTTDLLIQKLPFQNLVKEVALKSKMIVRFQVSAVLALHEAAEAYLVSLFVNSRMAATHAKHATVRLEDMRLALQLNRSMVI